MFKYNLDLFAVFKSDVNTCLWCCWLLRRSAVPAMKRFYNPPTIPHAFIGEFQIKYIIDLVDTLVNCGAVVRLCRKLRMFYSPPRSSPSATKAGVVPMPLLKQRVDINLTADTYRITHDAQDAADPSDLVYLELSRWGWRVLSGVYSCSPPFSVLPFLMLTQITP
jgi:hypothetical protein